jgi:hypothetical protein
VSENRTQETERREVRSDDPSLSPRANELLTHELRDAVGADEDVRGHGLAGAAGGLDRDGGVARLLAERHGRADEQADAGPPTHCIEQDRVQRRALQDIVRRPEAALHEAAERDLADLLPARQAADDDARGLAGGAAQGGAEPEIDEDAAGVGGELDAGAGLAKPRAALDEGDVVAAGAQGQRRR